jgi:imidazolonepropionase-like amidohydrolase
MSDYYKEFLPRAAEALVNICRGRLKSPPHKRLKLPRWEPGREDHVALRGGSVIDVDAGRLMEKTGVLFKGENIELLFGDSDYEDIKERYGVAREVDCSGKYLLPGLTDIHSHPGSVIEKISPREVSYFPAQREKNCEAAVQNGTTFLRVVGGNWGPLSYLKREIDDLRLMGPDWVCSYVPVIPRGGTWDFGTIKNAMGQAFLFGGKYADFIDSTRQLEQVLETDLEKGVDLIKTYQEEKPLYGFSEDTVYKMWTPGQLKIIRDFADRNGLPVACHAMFINGARMAIDAGVDTLEHMTVDSEYTVEDAEKMAGKGMGIAPTLGVGLFLAIEMGNRGYADDPDLRYFKEFRKERVPGYIERSTVPELRHCYMEFLEAINQGYEDDTMPGVGPIWPERVTGFAHFVRKSFENFRKAGVRVGIGTDGGLGTSFTGLLDPELHLSHYLGYSIPEVLRMATLGNMEIIGLEKERGSIEPGKKADLLVLGKNPLEDLDNVSSLESVFKRGRLYFESDAGAA